MNLEPVQVSVQDFRKKFPEFSDAETYSDALIENFIEQAFDFIEDRDAPRIGLGQRRRKSAILYMAAHLLSLYWQNTNGGITSGGQTGMVSSTTIGNVSVSLLAPPNQSQSDYWLNQTPYGAAYLNLIRSKWGTGIFYGGSDQRQFTGNNR